MSEPLFAVVDVETTGFHPGQHHRVAEIAVVRVDASGKVMDRWETLINPGRDLGPQSVHRIRAADILDAPTFQEAAPEIAEVLQGTVMVAHNLRFDAGFLEHEFRRAGMPVSLSRCLCKWCRFSFSSGGVLFVPGRPGRGRRGLRSSLG